MNGPALGSVVLVNTQWKSLIAYPLHTEANAVPTADTNLTYFCNVLERNIPICRMARFAPLDVAEFGNPYANECLSGLKLFKMIDPSPVQIVNVPKHHRSGDGNGCQANTRAVNTSGPCADLCTALRSGLELGGETFPKDVQYANASR